MSEARRVGIGVFVVSLGAMALELTMIRVFDFIFTRNLSFLIISAALFSLGLAGVYLSAHSKNNTGRESQVLGKISVLFGLSALSIQPCLNALAFDPLKLSRHPLLELSLLLGIYLLLCIPFVLVGLFFARTFSTYSERVGPLYAVDLVGAAVGAAIVLPLFPVLGPSGILAGCAAIAFIGGAILSDSRRWRTCLSLLAVATFCVSYWVPPNPADFLQRYVKGEQLSGGVKEAQTRGTIEYFAWDPLSRIDVLPGVNRKEVAYDGGAQATTLFSFDGDFDRLKSTLGQSVYRHFWNRGVLAAHALMDGQGSKVLVIGAGGGQEVKAALLYGASSVDAVEMIGAVVDLGARRYADYLGGIFQNPLVHFIQGEGRTFLQATRKKYNIIQIYSNHTTSSLASGSGAMDVSYLLTSEAFQNYFSHLEPGGILQINHPLYPRLVTTAALAWAKDGRRNLRQHVLVYQRDPSQLADLKPTFLIKMTPWTQDEVQRMDAFFDSELGEKIPWVKAEDPLDLAKGFLPKEFFVSPLPRDMELNAAYRITPATDNRPFFKFVRKNLSIVKPDPSQYTDRSVAGFLNTERLFRMPVEVLYFIILGAMSVLVAVLAILVPLLASKVRQEAWKGKWSTLGYFSLLGMSFIIIELVLIQKFMKIIGYPLGAYSAVMVALLVSAGLGSYVSSRLTGVRIWKFLFPAIMGCGGVLLVVFPSLSDAVMHWGTPARIIASMLMIAPLGFLLGMPFPLGIRAVTFQGRQTIAWAWGMNGLSTVVGGLASVVLSLLFGLDFAIIVALCLYGLAGLLLGNLERQLLVVGR